MSNSEVKEKLLTNKDNYHQWVTAIQDVFDINSIGHTIKENHPYDPADHGWKPGDSESNRTSKSSPGVQFGQESSSSNKQEKLQLDDELVRKIIRDSIAQALLANTANMQTAAEIWKYLEPKASQSEATSAS